MIRRSRDKSLSCVATLLFLSLFFPGSTLSQSLFPQDRSLDRRRIGLTRSVLDEMRNSYAQRSSSGSRTSTFLLSLERMKADFRTALTRPGKDFVSVSGYQYCSKAVSAMGILSAYGDEEAGSLGKDALLAAVRPFDGASVNLAEAPSVLNDRNQDYARRIKAFNRLQESGERSMFISRGDPIYLEVGQLSVCLGVGYDWFYQRLSPGERESAEGAMREILLWSNNLNESFFGTTAIAAQKESNWNAIMNGGSGALALSALADVSGFSCTSILAAPPTPLARRGQTTDTLARERICQAIVGLRSYLNAFTDSGTYAEGSSYWNYGMTNFSLFTDSVRTVLARNELWDWYSEKLRKGAEFQKQLYFDSDSFWASEPRNPSLISVYSFSDAPSALVPSSYPFLSIARQAASPMLRGFGLKVFAQQQKNEDASLYSPGRLWATHGSDWSRVFASLFLPDEALPSNSSARLSTFSSNDHRFDVGIQKTSPSVDSWSVYEKGGAALENHSHLDSGSFVLRVGSDSWFSDLGPEHGLAGYPEGYWTLPGDDTYTLGLRYFRKNDLSHNLVTIANRPLNIEGRAFIVSQSEGLTASDQAPYSRVDWDTSSLYWPVASRSSRSFILTQRGRYSSLDVIDTFEFAAVPPTNAEGALATWRGVSCGTDNQTVESTVLSSLGVPSIRLRRATNGVLQGLLVQAVQPSAPRLLVTAADPNSNPRIQASSLPVTQNTNPNCLLLELIAEPKHLRSLGDGRYSLQFVVRIQKELVN